MTAILAHLSRDDAVGMVSRPESQTAYTLREVDAYTTVSVTRGEVERWLAWKAARASAWNVAGVFLALVAAVAGIVAAVEGWLSLR